MKKFSTNIFFMFVGTIGTIKLICAPSERITTLTWWTSYHIENSPLICFAYVFGRYCNMAQVRIRLDYSAISFGNIGKSYDFISIIIHVNPYDRQYIRISIENLAPIIKAALSSRFSGLKVA